MGPGRLGHPGRRVDGHRARPPGHPAHPGRALPAVGPRLAGRLGRPALAGAGHPGRRPRRPARQLAGVRARRGPGGARREARRGARGLRRADGRPAVRVHRRALQRPAGARAHPADAGPAPAPAGLVRRDARARAPPAALARAGRPLAGRLPRGRRWHPRGPRVAPHPPTACARSSTASGRCAPTPASTMEGYDVVVEGDSHGVTSARCARRCSSGPTPAPPGGSSRGGTCPTRPRAAPRPAAASRSARAGDRVDERRPRARMPWSASRPPADADALVELRAVMFEAMGLAARRGRRPRLATARAHDWFADRVEPPGVRIVVAEVDGRGRVRARSARSPRSSPDPTRPTARSA